MRLPLERLGSIHHLQTGEVWSADDLVRQVTARARRLEKAGIGARSVVAIARPASPGFFADLFAVWSLGGTAACLDPGLTPAERETIARFAGAAAVLTGEGGPQEGWPVPVFALDGETPDAGATMPEGAGAGLDDPALILFTSGTTGAPKGVVLSFRAILARLSLNIAHIGEAALARTLLTLPVHFGHGLIGNSLTALFAGGRLHIPQTGLALASTLGRVVDDHRIGFFSSVPTLWRMALKLAKPPEHGTLMRVHVGSAPLTTELWSKIADWSGAEVVNCYGITETANWIGGASSRDAMEDGLIGRPWGGAAAVVGDDGRLHLEGEGEIAVQTPSLMSGYLDRPDLTGAVLCDGWYRTGDRGTVDEAGRIRLSGRIKDEINRAGFKVQPAEIDGLLERHGSVAEACAFGLPDAVSGEIVAAAVRLADGAGETAESLREWCLERLRREAVPERWFIVDEIPKTSRGKVSRDMVRKSLTETPCA
ncbi:acyl--CoA ligase [Kaustia mangrovi]|uniref:Acyl--CoA ligase n=1 Tax=Kaustia mangrovi TaxID=2593653 RepID=A0A7S8C303_9HYPH|nr:class I adenylate-forming enzyme family protein [Kaustia mangrovi]QPC42445.1 acyl--CoA ligase [Kaustia mangrovi]